MSHISLPILAAWTNAGLLLAAGLINLFGLASIHDLYADWDIPKFFYRSVGLLQILAAVFLLTPDMRVWGIVLAAPILFGSVVMLLDHRDYAAPAPAAAMMATLVIAILAVPPAREHHAVEVARPATAAMSVNDSRGASSLQIGN